MTKYSENTPIHTEETIGKEPVYSADDGEGPVYSFDNLEGLSSLHLAVRNQNCQAIISYECDEFAIYLKHLFSYIFLYVVDLQHREACIQRLADRLNIQPIVDEWSEDYIDILAHKNNMDKYQLFNHIRPTVILTGIENLFVEVCVVDSNIANEPMAFNESIATLPPRSLDQEHPYFATPLISACHNGAYKVVCTLLCLGAEVNFTTKFGMTALSKAENCVENGNDSLKILQAILLAGATFQHDATHQKMYAANIFNLFAAMQQSDTYVPSLGQNIFLMSTDELSMFRIEFNALRMTKRQPKAFYDTFHQVIDDILIMKGLEPLEAEVSPQMTETSKDSQESFSSVYS